METGGRDMPAFRAWVWTALVVLVGSVASQPSAMDAGDDSMGWGAGTGDSRWAASLDQSSSKLLLTAYRSLRRFDANNFVPVQWSDLDQDAKLELLSKVKVVLDEPDNYEHGTGPPPVAELEPYLELIMKSKLTCVETILGLHLGFFEHIAAKVDETKLNDHVASLLADPYVKAGLREVSREYELERRDRIDTENQDPQLNQSWLEALKRSIDAARYVRDETKTAYRWTEPQPKPSGQIGVKHLKIEGDPFAELEKVKEEQRRWEEEKRQSKMRGIRRPFPDHEWGKRDMQLLAKLRNAERMVNIAQNRGYRP